MKNLQKLSVILLVMGLVLGLMGCDEKAEDNYAKYYEGDYRDNRNGSVEVVNNTRYDMLLFTGEIISVNYIVGGVKSGSRNTVNFSNENDFQVGGYKLLRAVKQREFETAGDKSRVDHTVMATYGEGRRFTTDIVSTTDGDYQYTVNNRSRDYGLELRKNSPEGEKVAYLTKGQVRHPVKSPTVDELTLYPVWVAFNNVTKTIVTFTPADDVLAAQQIQPVRPAEDTVPIYFPLGGTSVNIVFPDVSLPFATIKVRNNSNLTANLRIANNILRAESNYTGIRSGTPENYEIRDAAAGLDLNFGMQDGQIKVLIRYEDDPNASTVRIDNGYVYNIELNLKQGADQGQASSYTAWLVKGNAIDTKDFLVSQ